MKPYVIARSLALFAAVAVIAMEVCSFFTDPFVAVRVLCAVIGTVSVTAFLWKIAGLLCGMCSHIIRLQKHLD